jgi:hypothetical protein
MATTELETRSDTALLALAQKCEGGMPQILDQFFGFLSRRTEFFADKSQDECMREVMKAFDKQCNKMDEVSRLFNIRLVSIRNGDLGIKINY